jgi:hypothetical protein
VSNSEDFGKTWNRLDRERSGLPRTGYCEIDVNPRDSDVLYATSLSGAPPEYMVNIEAKGMDINSKDPRQLFVADLAGGVWASTDRGESWRQESSGLASTSMTSVKVKEGRIYAGTQGSGVWRTRLY